MGPVPVGFAKEVRIHLRNPAPIPTEWSAGKLACRSAEEAALFTITPQSGVVQPGETQARVQMGAVIMIPVTLNFSESQNIILVEYHRCFYHVW
jgi:hypothetical protein